MSPELLPKSIEEKPDLNEILLNWTSISHPFKKRNMVFYQTVVAITILLAVIMFFLHELLLIVLVSSIAFVICAISTVPPIEVNHKVTPLGIDHAGKFFHWYELSAFWYEEKWGYVILVVQTRLPFPSQLRLVLDSSLSKNQVKEVIGRYLYYSAKPQKSLVNNISDWLVKIIPLETS